METQAEKKYQIEPKGGVRVEKGGLFGRYNDSIGINQAVKEEKVISVSRGSIMRRRDASS